MICHSRWYQMKGTVYTALLLLTAAANTSTALAQYADPRGVSTATLPVSRDVDASRDAAWIPRRPQAGASELRPALMVAATPARVTGSVLGAVIGAFGGIGAAYGIYWHYHPKPCNDCRAPDAGAWPVLGGALGAGAGGLLGWWVAGLSTPEGHAAPARERQ